MNPWFLLGAVLAVAAAGSAGYYKGANHGRAEVQQAWDKAYAKAQEEARAKEQAMQAEADRLRQEKDREIRNINARAAALSNSLRDRASRASAVPGAAQTGQTGAGCTGTGLSREDAEFLAGEAARADQLRAALRQCVAQYEALDRK